MQKKSTQSGFTIIEILVVVALMAVVFMGIVSLQTSSFKSQNSAMVSMDLSDLKYEIGGIVGKAESCSKYFLGKPSAETELQFAKKIMAGEPYGKLKITSIRLTNIVTLAADQRSANIQITGTKAGGNPATAAFDEKIPVYYNVNAANTITSCRGNASVCGALGGTWITDHCDFCTTLGGTIQASGACAVAGP